MDLLTCFQCLYPRPVSAPKTLRGAEVEQVFLLVNNVLKILGDLLTVTCPLGRSDGLDILCMTLCCPVWWASLEVNWTLGMALRWNDGLHGRLGRNV